MEFNFNSESNIRSVKTSSVKVFNNEAKLWISDECAEVCGCKVDGIPHTLKTEREISQETSFIIRECVFFNAVFD